jgi:hypothetical protein
MYEIAKSRGGLDEETISMNRCDDNNLPRPSPGVPRSGSAGADLPLGHEVMRDEPDSLLGLMARVVLHESAFRRARARLAETTRRAKQPGATDGHRTAAAEALTAYRKAERRLARSAERAREAVAKSIAEKESNS